MPTSAVLDAIQQLTPKPRGVHLVQSITAGVVKLQIWDSHGNQRAETSLDAEWFGEEVMDNAERLLDLLDPLPTGPRLHRG